VAKKKTVKKEAKARTLPARKTRNVKGGSVMSGAANMLRMLEDQNKRTVGNLR
jgi:hypothetical protein